MDELELRLANDLKEAMKSHEELRVSVLRMAITALRNKSIEKRSSGEAIFLTKEEVMRVLQIEVKKRKDAAEGFERGGRNDFKEKELAELRILAAYLPAEMTDEEIEQCVQEVFNQLGNVTMKDFGRVMGEVMKQTQGRAPGDKVSAAVRKILH